MDIRSTINNDASYNGCKKVLFGQCLSNYSTEKA